MKKFSTARKKRPIGVTFMSGVVLIFAVTHLVKFGSAIADWQQLSLLLQISPLYLAASGLGWGLIGLLTSFGLWFGCRFVRFLTIGLIFSYSAFYWLDRFLMAGTDQPQVNLPFLIGLNILIIITNVFYLNLPRTRSFFVNGDMRL